MSELVSPVPARLWPDGDPIQDATNSTTFHCIGKDGLGYATRLLLVAATSPVFSDVPTVNSISFKSVNANANGSPFYVWMGDTKPTVGIFVDGPQRLTLPGPPTLIWIRKTVAADVIEISALG